LKGYFLSSVSVLVVRGETRGLLIKGLMEIEIGEVAAVEDW
jgi:hypothetical protein